MNKGKAMAIVKNISSEDSCPEYAVYKEKKNKENENVQKKRDAERRLDDAEMKRYRKK